MYLKVESCKQMCVVDNDFFFNELSKDYLYKISCLASSNFIKHFGLMNVVTFDNAYEHAGVE